MKRFIAVPETISKQPFDTNMSAAVRGIETFLTLLALVDTDGARLNASKTREAVQEVLMGWGAEETICRQAELDILRDGVNMLSAAITEQMARLCKNGGLKVPGIAETEAYAKARDERGKAGAL